MRRKNHRLISVVLAIILSSMLAFRNRFHGHGALKYVYKNGTAKHGSMMTIKSVANERRKTPRIAVVVGKKVLKSAVGRNRIRRRMYEILREELPNIHSGRDIVCIITSAEVRTVEYATLRAEFESLLKQAKLYHTP